MATLRIPYDHSRDPMNPDHLGQLVAAALSLGQPPHVDIDPTGIVVRHPNVTDANTAAVQAVIDSYLLDPDWDLPAADRPAIQAIALLEQADRNWDTLTNAQRTAAMRLAVRVSARVARLVLGKLD